MQVWVHNHPSRTEKVKSLKSYPHSAQTHTDVLMKSEYFEEIHAYLVQVAFELFLCISELHPV